LDETQQPQKDGPLVWRESLQFLLFQYEVFF